MNAIVEMPGAGLVQAGRMRSVDVIDHVRAVQEVMRTVMKEGVHYGMVPGTDKPTLLKPGAEVLCVAFRIADTYNVEDLSAGDAIRYRVTCTGSHQMTGVVLGSGMGEGSTGEEKYKWRKAVCAHEFEGMPEDRRRTKYAKSKGGTIYTVDQVRTDPADLANTVLKMACKRAKMAMVLNVTGASDIFGQDLEDLDELLREHLTEDEISAQAAGARSEWESKAKATTTPQELQRLVKEAVAYFNKAKDVEGYKAFSKVVQSHGAALRAREATHA
jgi:hypothetical protein